MNKKSKKTGKKNMVLISLAVFSSIVLILFNALRPTETEYTAWLQNEKSIECQESYLKCVDSKGNTLYFKEQSITDGFLILSLNHTIYSYEDEKVAFSSKSIGIFKNFI